MTQLPTTEQGTGWVVCDLDGKRIRPIKKAVCVHVEGDPDGTFMIADIEKALTDPANVMEVSAMPEVVKQGNKVLVWMRKLQDMFRDEAEQCGFMQEDGDLIQGFAAALALVHPAQEDKK